MSEGFHSHVGANLAGSAGTCWRCQGLAGVIDALWWCPTITVEMTAAACVMPDRKEHLPTMARFHRRSCFPNGQGRKNQKIKRSEEEELRRTSCQRGKRQHAESCAAMPCKMVCWGVGCSSSVAPYGKIKHPTKCFTSVLSGFHCKNLNYLSCTCELKTDSNFNTNHLRIWLWCLVTCGNLFVCWEISHVGMNLWKRCSPGLLFKHTQNH